MIELKKCPFCGEHATGIATCMQLEECAHFEECLAVEPYVCIVCSIDKGGCGASTGYYDSAEKANEAWNRRAQPENEPLTLDELRQMDGEPVWIVAHPDWGHWELSEYAEDYLEDRDEDFYGMAMPPAIPDPMGRYGLHMLGWLAYRRKPERSEG